MTLSDALGLSDEQERILTRVLQLTLFGIMIHGLVTRQTGRVVMLGLALGITLLPTLLRREYGYAMDAGIVLWITTAMVLHTLGSLGLYVQYPWYDEVTHAISGTIVAGLGYAAFRALELHSSEIMVTAEFRAVFVVVFVLAAGILWEILEFAFGSLFPVYGIGDIVTDMIGNAIGGLIVAVWGTSYVSGLIGFFRERLSPES